MKGRINKEKIIFSTIGYTFVVLMSIICVLPFLLVISGSFTSESSIYEYGFRLIPVKFSLNAYQQIFLSSDAVLKAYTVTILLTVCGSLIGLFLTSMTAYALSRPYFKSRNVYAIYFYFTTLFSGGLVPWYILMVSYLKMKNSYLALLVPLIFSVFDIIIMRSFMKTIPEALAESTKIDGATEFRIFRSIYIPLSKPSLATIGLFIALRYWNDWYNALLFIGRKEMYPLQYYLYSILMSAQYYQAIGDSGISSDTMFPAHTFKLAMTVVATGPIILLYPFIQKYFISGLTIGSVKG